METHMIHIAFAEAWTVVRLSIILRPEVFGNL